jgi:tetratricopeptide (TPR) repeat protein
MLLPQSRGEFRNRSTAESIYDRLAGILVNMRKRGVDTSELEMSYAGLVGDTDERIAALRRAIQLAPGSSDPVLQLAALYEQLGRHDEAARR